MIICSCNVFSDREVRDLLASNDAPRRVCDVYAGLGHRPCCGACARSIRDLIRECGDTGCQHPGECHAVEFEALARAVREDRPLVAASA